MCGVASSLRALLVVALLPLSRPHSYQVCVGTDDLGANVICQGEKVHIYYNSNHRQAGGWCFQFGGQGGIKVAGTGTDWQRRPGYSSTNNNIMTNCLHLSMLLQCSVAFRMHIEAV